MHEGPSTGAPTGQPARPQPDNQPGPQPADVRFLRWLVTALAGVMIAGLVIIVALLAVRLQSPAPGPDLPAALALPQGARALAFTQGSDWVAVVTDADEILIFDRSGTRLRQRIAILPDD